MQTLPKEWCTDVCPDVVLFLNQKYNTNYIWDNTFYWVDQWSAWCDDTMFWPYLTHEEFMEAISPNTMKVGDMVFVSMRSSEDAIDGKKERELLAILPKDIQARYICRDGEIKNQTAKWKYAVPIIKEKKKLRELRLTDSEWEKVKAIYS